MQPQRDLTFIRNRYRARELRLFRALVVDYFERSQRDADDLPLDWEGAQMARARIHRMLPRVLQVVRAAGLGGWAAHSMDTDPGPALGRIEVLQRIFSARYADGFEQEVLDVLDMALGVYDGDQVGALVRTFNPLHYLGTALAFVARGPRRFMAAIGFRRAGAPGITAADLARLEAAVARLGDIDEVIESRFAALQDRQAARAAQQTEMLAELAERLDFAERVLAQPRSPERLPTPGRAEEVPPGAGG